MKFDKLDILIYLSVFIVVLLIILLTKKSDCGEGFKARAGAIDCDMQRTEYCMNNVGCSDPSCTACPTYDGSNCVPNECAKDNCVT
jgi:hypothetical protein